MKNHFPFPIPSDTSNLVLFNSAVLFAPRDLNICCRCDSRQKVLQIYCKVAADLVPAAAVWRMQMRRISDNRDAVTGDLDPC